MGSLIRNREYHCHFARHSLLRVPFSQSSIIAVTLAVWL
jgi:hypothetical protein